MKIYKHLFLFFIPLMMFARINPFEPVVTPENIKIKKPKYFHQIKVYLPNDARILKKIVFVYQTLDSDIKQKEVSINKAVDFHSPIIITHIKKEFPLKVLSFPTFKLYIKNKKLFFATKDKLLRVFFLATPFRLVLDFKRNVDFLTIQKVLKNSFVKKVVVGSHSGFYRVVVYFDAKYSYNVKKDINGVLIELK